MKIYDVTFPMSATTPIYEGDPAVKISAAHAIADGAPANVSQIFCGVHTATHVDAPAHFIEGGRQIHDIALDKLLGACRVIELDDTVLAIEPRHLERMDDATRVLFKTRNSAFWTEPEKGFRRDYTYLTPEAARALVKRQVQLVGIDYLSVEKYGAETFGAHITLLENEVAILEGLDLRAVPEGDYELICLPLKYIGGAGDGAPARAILRRP